MNRAKYDQRMEAMKAALKKGINADIIAAESALKEAEKELASEIKAEVFAGLQTMKDAVEKYKYEVLSHKVEKSDDGIPTGVNEVLREKQIELVDFAKFRGLPTGFKAKMTELFQTMSVRAGLEMGIKPKDLTQIGDSNLIKRLAKQVDKGETPTSNRSLLRLLQGIVDEVLPEEKVKVSSHDVAYLLNAFTKKSRDELTIETSRTKGFYNLIADTLHAKVTGKDYKLNYKGAKNSTPVTVKQDDSVKVSADKDTKKKNGKAA